MKFNIALVASVMLVVVNSVNADDCTAILQQGIRDEIKIDTYDQFEAKLSSLMSKSFEEVRQEANKGSGGGEVAIGILKAAGGGGGEEQKFNQMKTAYASDKQAFMHSEQFRSIALSLVNKSVVDAWRDCMSGKKILDFYTGNPLEEFTVGIRYVRRDAGDANSIKVSDATITNLELLPNVAGEIRLKPDLKIEEFEVVLQRFRRTDRKKQATINIALGGNGSIAFSFDPEATPTTAPTTQPVPRAPEVQTKVLINDRTRFQCPLDQKAGDNNLGGNWLVGAGTARLELRPGNKVFLVITAATYEANDQANAAGDGSRRFGEAQVEVGAFPDWEKIEFVVPGGGPPIESIAWPISPLGAPGIDQDAMLNMDIQSLPEPLRRISLACKQRTTRQGLVGGWGLAAGNKIDVIFKKVEIKLTRRS